jgi:hypothetical protein
MNRPEAISPIVMDAGGFASTVPLALRLPNHKRQPNPDPRKPFHRQDATEGRQGRQGLMSGPTFQRYLMGRWRQGVCLRSQPCESWRSWRHGGSRILDWG